MDPNHSGRGEKYVGYERSWGPSRVRADSRETAEEIADVDDEIFGGDDGSYPMMPGEKLKGRGDIHEQRGTVEENDYFD